jgi:hypothetical protein
MTSSTSSAPAASTSSTWLKIWRSIGVVIFCQSSVTSKVVMGVVYTCKACRVFDIKITFWPIPIWCGVKGTLVDKNSKDSNMPSSIVYEGLTCSSYFLSDLSLPSIGWQTTVVTGTCIVKVWKGKGMISKPIPPLSGLNGLVIGYTTYGVTGILLLV